MDEETDRGTGRTSKQMKEAPAAALFVWCNRQALSYARALAGTVGRSDLRIESPDILDRRADRLRGLRLAGIVVDHAALLTDEQQDGLRIAEGSVRLT